MLIYCVLFFWCIISGAFFKINKYVFLKKVYVVINFIPLILVVGLRYPWNGRDTEMYIERFQLISSINIDSYLNFFEYDSRTEYGYSLLNKIVSMFTSDYHILFLVLACITFVCIGKFLLKNSSDIWISMIILYGTLIAFSPMNTVRQDIAVAIVLSGYHFLKYDCYKKYIFFVFVLIGSLFHNVAFLYFICLFLLQDDKKISCYKTIKWIIAMSGVLIISSIFIQTLLSNFPMYEVYINSKFLNGDVTQNISIFNAFIRNIFLYILPIGCLLYGIKYDIYLKQDRIDAYYCSIFLSMVFILNIIGYYMALILRLAMALDYFSCIAIPLCLKIFNRHKVIYKIIIIGLWIIYFGIKLFLQYKGDHIQEYPLFI